MVKNEVSVRKGTLAIAANVLYRAMPSEGAIQGQLTRSYQKTNSEVRFSKSRNAAQDNLTAQSKLGTEAKVRLLS